MLIEKLTDHDTIVKEFSFADILKKFLIKTHILTYRQAYGNEEDRNSLTLVSWHNLPADICEKFGPVARQSMSDEETKKLRWELTAREVMQVFGTDIMRNMFYDEIWVDSTMTEIHEWMDRPDLDPTVKRRYPIAVLSDTRFRNELAGVKGLRETKGITIYTTRPNNPATGDGHSSENDISPEDCDFHFVADNLEQLEKHADDLVETLKTSIKKE